MWSSLWIEGGTTDLVAQTELFLAKTHAASEAFSYAEAVVCEFTGEFETDTAQA